MGSARVQGDLWGTKAQEWATLQEPLHKPLWEAMLRATGVRLGTQFFDAGCGGGGASVLADQQGAKVTGLDASEALIAVARARIPNGDFRSGELESLPYPDQSFDVILAANSLQYTENPLAALRELKRVCRPDGRIAIATWGAPEYCEQRDLLKAVRDALPSPPSGGGPFALSAPGLLEQFVEQGGFKVDSSAEVDCPFEYPDLAAAWRAQSSAGPLQNAIRATDAERIKSAAEGALKLYQMSDGRVRLNNRFRFVTAIIQ